MAEGRSVAVTGAGGFIGGALVRHLHARGWRVVALARRRPSDPVPGVRYERYTLEDARVEALLHGVDCLVHCAYAREDAALNVDGTRRLVECSRSAGVGKRVFLSSFSARADAPSSYGRHKHAAEALFGGPADCVVRPGLVIGNGGLVRDMVAFIRARGVVPLVDGGRQPVQTIGIGDLVQAIDRILTCDLGGAFALAEPEPVTYRAFCQMLCAAYGLRARMIPVPGSLLRAAVRAAASLRIPLPVAGDSLLGVTALRAVDTRPDLERLGLAVHPCLESLRQAALALGAMPPVADGAPAR